ncbi:MAG: phosphate/phosphite/phosphonate ABC transporter substrate-binding protein [Nitrospirota bacterium]
MKFFFHSTVLKRIILVTALILFCSSPAFSRQQITMMLIPLQSPSTMYKNFLPLKRYLEDKLNISIKIRVARETADMPKHLEKGDADIAFLCPTIYCEAYSKTSIVPLVKLSINGSTEERSVLVVRDDSSVKKTADLLDKTLAYGRYKCPGSGLLPKIMLQRVGISDKDFLEVVKLGSDESSLTAVMARMFDATGVPEMTAKPYLNSGLRIVKYSYSIPQYLFVARAAIGKGLIHDLKNAMLSVNSLKNKKDIIGSIGAGVDGFSETKDSDYDIVRVLMSSVPGEKEGIILRQHGGKRFVVEPVSFGPDVFIQLNPLIEYLARMTGSKFQLIIPENAEAFIKIMNKGEGDIFLQNYHLYMETKKTGRAKGIAAIVEAGNSEDNVGVIIAHSVSNIRTIKDLADRRIGITSLHSDGGYISQKNLLTASGVPMNGIKFVELKTYENVIMQVYRGSVDAGFVSLSSLKSMQDDIDTSRIVILAKTPPLHGWVLSARKDMDRRFVDNAKRHLVQYSKRQTMELQKQTGIKAFRIMEE